METSAACSGAAPRWPRRSSVEPRSQAQRASATGRAKTGTAAAHGGPGELPARRSGPAARAATATSSAGEACRRCRRRSGVRTAGWSITAAPSTLHSEPGHQQHCARRPYFGKGASGESGDPDWVRVERGDARADEQPESTVAGSGQQAEAEFVLAGRRHAHSARKCRVGRPAPPTCVMVIRPVVQWSRRPRYAIEAVTCTSAGVRNGGRRACRWRADRSHRRPWSPWRCRWRRRASRQEPMSPVISSIGWSRRPEQETETGDRGHRCCAGSRRRHGRMRAADRVADVGRIEGNRLTSPSQRRKPRRSRRRCCCVLQRRRRASTWAEGATPGWDLPSAAYMLDRSALMAEGSPVIFARITGASPCEGRPRERQPGYR